MTNHRIAVLTSCTSAKQYKPTNELTQQDFELPSGAFEQRACELHEYSLPAYQMYTGNQHARLMVGIEDLRSTGSTVDLHIISAGYGLLHGDTNIVPYECTFSNMKAKQIVDWSSRRNIPEDTRKLFQKKDYDLLLVLLGDDYLRALQLTDDVVFGSPTLFLCASKSERFIRGSGNLHIQKLLLSDATLFRCGLVGLKGELARRLLVALIQLEEIPGRIFDGILDFLDDPELESDHKIAAPMLPVPAVDFTLSKDNLPRSQPRALKYFIPDWDDSVDADYDFINEAHSVGRGNWASQVYAHQIYDRPNYDGLLISRAVVEKSATKRATLFLHKLHPFMRVPPEFPVMGDCGAFSYIDQDEPPYRTDEMLDYYTELGFDYGVSIDHLWFGADTPSAQQSRYDLTIANAHDFLREHKKRGLTWTPIGAIQGWDVDSYTFAARQLADMGYTYIGLGGLVRTRTKQILDITKAIRQVIPPDVRLHIFGVARPDAIRAYQKLNVTSVDSASALRKAWTDVTKGYYTLETTYSALRIPYVEPYIRQTERRGEAIEADALRKLERDALRAVRELDADRLTADAVLDALLAYESAICPEGRDMTARYRRTLEDKPWRHCDCTICRETQVEVAIFRGNNRNRRRGFHNTYIFYEIMQRILRGEQVSEEWIGSSLEQLKLPFTGL